VQCMPPINPTVEQTPPGYAPPPAAKNYAAEPCSGCGRQGVAFSNRQMLLDWSKRKCIECLPPRGIAAIAAVAEALVLPSDEEPFAKRPKLEHGQDQIPLFDVATVSEGPCPECGRSGVEFSKRQLTMAPERRKCVDCLIQQQPELLEENVPKLTPAEEPCSSCGRQGALFSKRQIQVDASLRRCLECMAAEQADRAAARQNVAGVVSAVIAGKQLTSQASMTKMPFATGVTCAGAPMAAAGLQSAAVRLGAAIGPIGARSTAGRLGPSMVGSDLKSAAGVLAPMNQQARYPILQPTPAVTGLLQAPALQLLPTTSQLAQQPNITETQQEPENVPCSSCGQFDVSFSNRQMKVPWDKRKCVQCMPPINPTVEQTPPGYAPPPAAKNYAAEPCSGCGRHGVAFSNRQMLLEWTKRKCIDCLPPRGIAALAAAAAEASA